MASGRAPRSGPGIAARLVVLAGPFRRRLPLRGVQAHLGVVAHGDQQGVRRAAPQQRRNNRVGILDGARTVAQLDDNLRAADLVLSAEQVKRLDDASAFDIGYPYGILARLR